MYRIILFYQDGTHFLTILDKEGALILNVTAPGDMGEGLRPQSCVPIADVYTKDDVEGLRTRFEEVKQETGLPAFDVDFEELIRRNQEDND